ncbi:unnamed protein product [Adineta steineri]|uniref:Uncharacterized protein n=1 Tax=Adineta steineri TaxID=433720 RepID=A0A815PXB5_9BILA|nr:unnamed protein product [Adineta steineri]CAF3975157.1 unnamed protein product [Adineta steineri]
MRNNPQLTKYDRDVLLNTLSDPNSLDKKETEIIIPDKDEKLDSGNPRGSLRLDCQGMVGDRSSMNFQIQFGRHNTGPNGSYANVILPGDYHIGCQRLKELFLDSLKHQKTIKVEKGS